MSETNNNGDVFLTDEMIENRRQGMPDEATLYDLADFFKIFADSTRMRILFALDSGPLCVSDIAKLLELSESAVCHHLKSLRQSNLITHKRQGKNVIYTLADDHVKDIIEKGLSHIEE